MFGRIISMGVVFAVLPIAVLAAPPAPLTCLIAPDKVSNIGTDRNGIVVEVPVRRADRVEAGQVLVRLDPRIVQSELEQSVIRTDALRTRIARNAQLGANSLVSGEEMDQLRTELALAEAESARGTLELERTEIRAPFAGVVAQIGVAVGELTGATPLLQLIDVNTIRAEMVFLDAAFGQIAQGDRLPLIVDQTGQTVEVVVDRIDPFIDSASNSFTVVAMIDNRDLGLPTGVSCRLAQE